jgi:hypothetical protein
MSNIKTKDLLKVLDYNTRVIRKLQKEMRRWNIPKSHQRELIALRKTRVF